MSLKAIDDKPVFDAKKPLRLIITDADIKKANRKEPEMCVAAVALRRCDNTIQEARVHLSRVYVRTTPDKWTRYVTPVYLRQELISFDRGGAFARGEYTLMAPNPARRSTGKRQGSVKTHQNPKGSNKRRAYHTIADVRGGPA